LGQKTKWNLFHHIYLILFLKYSKISTFHDHYSLLTMTHHDIIEKYILHYFIADRALRQRFTHQTIVPPIVVLSWLFVKHLSVKWPRRSRRWSLWQSQIEIPVLFCAINKNLLSFFTKFIFKRECNSIINFFTVKT